MKVLSTLLLAGAVVTNLAPAYASLRNVELQKVVEEDEPTLALEPNIEYDTNQVAADESSNRMLGRKGYGNNKFKKNGGNNMNKKKKFGNNGNGMKFPWKKNGSSSTSKDDTLAPSAASTPNSTPTVGTNKTLSPSAAATPNSTPTVGTNKTLAPNPGVSSYICCCVCERWCTTIIPLIFSLLSISFAAHYQSYLHNRPKITGYPIYPRKEFVNQPPTFPVMVHPMVLGIT